MNREATLFRAFLPRGSNHPRRAGRRDCACGDVLSMTGSQPFPTMGSYPLMGTSGQCSLAAAIQCWVA